MPPKTRITRTAVEEAAVALVRRCGVEGLNARALAGALGCSTQPVFSRFSSMEEVRAAVIRRADECYNAMVETELGRARYPAYKASGMAYITFAREEKELFKLLFMRSRSGEEREKDEGDIVPIIEMIRKNTGLKDAEARLFHLEMWAFVHGLAVMAATDYCMLDRDLISRMVTDIYQGIKSRFCSKEEK